MSNGVKWLIGVIIGVGVLAFVGVILIGSFLFTSIKSSVEVEGTTIQESEIIEDEAITTNHQPQETIDWDTVEPIDYKQLKKNPDKYKSEKVVYEGVIVQIMEDGKYTDLRLAINGDYDSIIFVKYFGLTDFVEDDTVKIYGTVFGSYNYTSTANHNISLPAVIADNIE